MTTPLLHWPKTKTSVHGPASAARSRARGLRMACRTCACLMLATQLWLWGAIQLYADVGRAGWMAMAAQAVPMLLLWLLWRGRPVRRPGLEKAALALLTPCLLWDAAWTLNALCALCEAELLPSWPRAAVCALVAGLGLITLRASGQHGIPYGLHQLKWSLIVLALLATALAGAHPDGRNLRPILGPGLGRISRSALSGVGCTWPAALLFVLPDAAVSEEKKEAQRVGCGEDTPKALLYLAAAWAAGLLLALFQGLCAPLREGLNAGQRQIALLWLSDNPILVQLGTLCWLALPLCAFLAGLWYTETAARTLAPRLPRSLGALALCAAAAALALLPPDARTVWENLSPWRAVPAALGGALATLARLQGRKRA
ncbi:MAG: hypothetical protein PHY12_09645 [Eubacteriales bacterium]|nr:hypothetical protein [Eubacteriales bacterium]